MKNFAKIAGISLALALAGSAHALTFNEVQNTHFTEYFSVTPTGTDKLLLSVSGLTSQFTGLSFDFVSLAGLEQSISILPTAANVPAQISVSFSDIRNKFGTGATAAYSLLGGTPYLLKISGDTRSSINGGQATVTFTSLNAVVTSVPEPESYAMLLAGLGLVGTVVRRRRGKLSF